MGIKRKIVLVDDLQFHLISTRERLKPHYDIYTAMSSSELYEILSKVNPDLILLDINMPGEDGFELLDKLKEDSRYSYIPVIFLSAQIDKESIIKGMSLGAVDFIPKPYTDTDLIESIERATTPNIRHSSRPIILTVDDNPTELKTIHFYLKDYYTVYTLPEAEKIRDFLRVITPDLFLLDCQMPVLSGFDLVPIIRGISRHEETPIIFVTSEGSIENISTAMQLGACDYIIKPVDEGILLSKAEQHLADYILRRRIRGLGITN